MKKLLIFLLIAFLFNISFSQNNIKLDSLIKDSITIYVDSKSNIYLNNEYRSYNKFKEDLKKFHGKPAKFATVFPTPLDVFQTVDKVNIAMKEEKIESKWYRDPNFTIPFGP